jgi:guanylate kinase
MKKGHLYFILWVSGGGKGTLRENLQKTPFKKDFLFIHSYVTRPMRPGEIDGEKYHFISETDFQESIKKWEFLEYEINHKTAYYGTKKKDVEDGMRAGKIVLSEIDTKGLKQVMEKHPHFRKNFTSFFLDIPDDILRERFFARNPQSSEQDFQNRLESAQFEREQAQEFCDFVIDATQSPETVLQQVLAIIQK